MTPDTRGLSLTAEQAATSLEILSTLHSSTSSPNAYWAAACLLGAAALRQTKTCATCKGTGFITELQSLLHPDFDSDLPDAHDGVRWLSVRRSMLGAQLAYIPKRWSQSHAARNGIYGLSAGENEAGNGYYVGGVDLPDQKLIHPHYILMSSTLNPQAQKTFDLLERMEKASYFPPWGMVENLNVDGRSYLAMEGSLNAGFEALSAYHLFAKNRKIPDAIYAASLKSPQIRRAMQLFYPPAAKTVGMLKEAPSQ